MPRAPPVFAVHPPRLPLPLRPCRGALDSRSRAAERSGATILFAARYRSDVRWLPTASMIIDDTAWPSTRFVSEPIAGALTRHDSRLTASNPNRPEPGSCSSSPQTKTALYQKHLRMCGYHPRLCLCSPGVVWTFADTRDRAVSSQ
jgi:hypothetical protein